MKRTLGFGGSRPLLCERKILNTGSLNEMLLDVEGWLTLITDWLEEMAPQGAFQRYYSWAQRAFLIKVSEMK